MSKKSNSSQEFTIRYSESRCIIFPVSDVICKLLTYTKKTLERESKPPFKTVTKRVQTPMYKLEPYQGMPAIHTFGGFFTKVYVALLQAGANVITYDERNPFPKPNLSQIGGFIHTQEEVFLKLVKADMSGIAELITRYGKTMVIANICRAFKGQPGIVATDGSDPLDQLVNDLKVILPDRDIVKIGGGSKKRIQGDDITVVSYDSLDLCNPAKTRYVVGDEIHTLPVDSRIPVWVKFMHCRKFGLTGSLTGRFDGRDPLIEGLIGPVLVKKTYTDAINDGAICPLKVLALRVPTPEVYSYNRNKAYDNCLYLSPDIIAATRVISTSVIDHNTQAILFISNEKQADKLAETLGESAIVAMAKKLTAKQRKDLVGEMKSSNVKRCISSEIFATGMTFQDLAVVVNLAGGGASTSCVQKPGRLLQVRPGKKCGTLIEFFFDVTSTMRATGKYENPLGEDDRKEGLRRWGDTSCLHRDSVARFGVYMKNGYTVEFFDSLSDLQSYYRANCV